MAMHITDTKTFYSVVCLFLTLGVTILIGIGRVDAAVDKKHRRCLAL